MRKTIAAMLIVLVAAACGSNGSNDETTASTTTPVVEETTTTEATEAPVDDTTTETTEVVEDEPVLEAPTEQPAPPAEAGTSPQIADPFNPPAGPNNQALVSMPATERVHPDLLVNIRAVPYSAVDSVGGTLRAGVVGNDCTRGHSIHMEKTDTLAGMDAYTFNVYVGELADCTPTVDGLHLAVTGGDAPSGYWTIDIHQ